MTTIAEAVAAEDVQEDKLYHAARSINQAKCLPDETKKALIGHISAARAKHPATRPAAGDTEVPDTRPSKFAGAAGAVAKATKS